jgi:membrane protease YdiL (CAAX protease family)
MQTLSLYHRLWVRLFPNRWVLGLFLIFLFGIPRVLLVMNANVTGQTQWVSIIFTLMFFTPLLFLRKAGRWEMGVLRSSQPLWLLWGFLLGCGMCLLLFFINRLIFGLEISNPFVYIASMTTSGDTSMVYFLIYLAIMMTFSPIGEELFYRGVVFNRVRKESGSILGAILTHAGFNFAMGFLMFYAL